MARSSARQGAEDRPARVLIDDFHHIRYDCPPSAPTATLCMPGYPLATCALQKGVGCLLTYLRPHRIPSAIRAHRLMPSFWALS